VKNIPVLIQARLNSTRFPRKAVLPVAKGLTLTELVYRRILAARTVDPAMVCFVVPDTAVNAELREFLAARKIPYFAGDEDNVYGRFSQALGERFPHSPAFVRVCADNPFIDPELLDDLIGDARAREFADDYSSFRTAAGTPTILTHYGLFAELIRTATFLAVDSGALTQVEREHVTPHFYRNEGRYTCRWLPVPDELEDLPLRLTVDFPEDRENCRELYDALPDSFGLRDIVEYVRSSPELLARMKAIIDRSPK